MRATLFQLVQLQNIGHELGKPPGGIRNRFGIFASFYVCNVGLLKHGGIVTHNRQRRFQLMGYVGNEVCPQSFRSGKLCGHFMPNESEVGYADYVLFGANGKPLAVLEAKRTCKDVAVGRQQAKLYADLLEKKFGQRPIIFLSNGFDTRIWNDRYYPEHPVSGIYSKPY